MGDFELFTELREEFKAQLAGKTGWGRNEVLEVFDQAAVRVVRARRRPAAYPVPEYPVPVDPQYPEPWRPYDPEYPNQ